MSKKSELHHMFIKYKGIFDLLGLFKMMRDFIMEQGYQWDEQVVKHKVPGPSGAEDQYKWTAWKKVTEYTKFHIETYMHIWDLKEIEVVKSGKKTVMYQGRILIRIIPMVELDYNNRFEGSKFMLALRDWFHEYVWKHEIEDIWEDGLYYYTYKYHKAIKEYLEFESATNAAQERF